MASGSEVNSVEKTRRGRLLYNVYNVIRLYEITFGNIIHQYYLLLEIIWSNIVTKLWKITHLIHSFQMKTCIWCLFPNM